MDELISLIKGVAPALATALGGPLAGAAVSFLSSKLGVDPSIVQQAVAGMSPSDLVKMKEIDDSFQLEMQRQGIQLQMAQIAVNTEEAKSTNWFVAGWRPAVGWIGAFSLAYASIIEPILRFVSTMNGYTGKFPLLDTNITMQVLFGMLGLGVARTVEKLKGAESNR